MLYEDNSNTNLLGLANVFINKIEETPSKFTIFISTPVSSHDCPKCGTSTSRVHDYREQRIKDLPIRGIPVFLVLDKRRYVCPECGKRFYPTLDFVPRYHHMTSRLYPQLINELRNSVTIKSVAKRYNVSSSTVTRIFGIVNYGTSKLPTVLAIDEFKGNAGAEKYQAIITDPSNHKILDICPSRDKNHLYDYFKGFDDRKNVKFFVSDMWEPYSQIAKHMFPNAIYIIDKYHYVRQVYWALNNVRKRVQKTLNKNKRIYFKHCKRLLEASYDSLDNDSKQELRIMLSYDNDLDTAWQLKELFSEFRRCSDSLSGEEILNRWLLTAEECKLAEFHDCIRAFRNWLRPILNSLDYPYTNAYTEGANNKIKVLKRVAYGFRNFQRFRNRILHLAK